MTQTASKKVASQRFYAKLKTSGDWDLGIRDSEFDLLKDTNTQLTIDPRDWELWQGPDIWNRDTTDGLVNQWYENPEYHNSVNDSAFLYIRIKNTGCTASPATGNNLHLYWTKGSSGEVWAADWTTANVTGAGNATLPKGRELTSGAGINVPALAPGQDTILRKAWRPVKPQDYDTSQQNQNMHLCILARIEETSLPSNGLNETTGNVTPNLIRNKNIAMRNMLITNVNTSNFAPGPLHPVLVANADPYSQVFSLEVLNDKATHRHLHGDLSEYITGKLYLGDLWDLWVAGGKLGSDIGTVDPASNSVTYDPSAILRLDNLEIPGGKGFETNLQLTVRKGVQIFNPITDHMYLRQILPGAGLEGADYVYGAFGFELNLRQNAEAPRRQVPADLAQGPASDEDYLVFPNPAHEYVVVQRAQPGEEPAAIRLLDVTGRTVRRIQMAGTQRAVTLPLQGLSAGLYFVEVQGAGSGHRYKLIVE